MRNFITSFLFVFIFNMTDINGQTRIKGVIQGDTGIEIEIFSPVNGFSNNWINSKKDNLKVDSTGSFMLDLVHDDPVFFTLKINNNPIWLLIQPTDTIDIVINMDSVLEKTHSGWLYINGNNSAGHMLFNEMNYYPYDKLAGIAEIIAGIRENSNELIEKIKTEIEIKVAPFEKMVKSGLITTEYFVIIQKTIQSNLLSEALKHFFRKSELYRIYTKGEIDSIKSSLFSICPADDSLLYKGLETRFYLYYYYLNDHLNLIGKSFETELTDSTIVSEFNSKKIFIEKSFTPLLGVRDTRMKEYLWGTFIYNFLILFSDYFGSKDIEAFENIFPQSSYLNWVKKLDVYHSFSDTSQVKSINKTGRILFLDSIQKYNSLKELISGQLSKGILYFDVWASWCIPCRQEFIASKTIDSFFYSNGIKKVYISIDDYSFLRNWVSAIENYKLEGFHVLASKELISDLVKQLKISKSEIEIPRYFVVINGKIIIHNAYRPTEKYKLLLQLEKLFDYKPGKKILN